MPHRHSVDIKFYIFHVRIRFFGFHFRIFYSRITLLVILLMSVGTGEIYEVDVINQRQAKASLTPLLPPQVARNPSSNDPFLNLSGFM